MFWFIIHQLKLVFVLCLDKYLYYYKNNSRVWGCIYPILLQHSSSQNNYYILELVSRDNEL